MAAYEALYRKWRPQTFDDIVAQPHITKTLKNQIMRRKTAHAYLFTGSRGTGKTTCARIFAKAINCLHPVDGCPCLDCEICRDAEKGALTDIIEIDGASNNGVDEVRNLRENATFMPVRCEYKVYIIDEVHMMSAGAFNALLKMIEEPPAHVKFVLATTEIHKVPATILSRCQRFDFRRILPADIAARIQYIASNEDFTITDDAAYRIAVLSDGGLRDALSLLDQCAAVSQEITAETVEEAVGVAGTESVYAALDAIAKRDAAAALELIDRLYRQSKDMTRFADEISQHLRSLMLLKAAPDSTALSAVMPAEREQLSALAEAMPMPQVLYALREIRSCCDRMTRAGSRRMELEMTLIRLCSDGEQASPDTEAMQNRIAGLEKMIAEIVNRMRQGLPAAQPRRTESQSRAAIPAKNLQVTGETDLSGIPPLRNWQTVLERFSALCPSVNSLLDNSDAYVIEEKNIILVIARNPLFKNLFGQKEAGLLRDAAEQVLGKRYQVRYKNEAPEAEQGSSPVDELLRRAKENGIEVAERKPGNPAESTG